MCLVVRKSNSYTNLNISTVQKKEQENNTFSTKENINKPQIFRNDILSVSTPTKAPISLTLLEIIPKQKDATIQLFTSYGNENEINIKGRVIKTKDNFNLDDNSILNNIIENIELLSNHEVKGEDVNLDFNGKTFKVTTDSEGYFNTKLKHFGSIPSGINNFTAKLADGQKYKSELTKGQVTIQTTNDKTFGIVSDIDDTIQESYATNKLKAVETLFSKNYKTQKEILGTSELYQALDKRNDGKEDGDLYYISGSPVQISERIENFLDLHDFPEGSLDLKRMGFGSNEDSPTKQVDYKLGKLRNLFNEYPNKKFILFGDSGEKDPEIYKQISKEFPNRVIATFINNVTNDNKKSPRYEGMLLTNNSLESAQDLYKRGLITKEDLETVKKAIK